MFGFGSKTIVGLDVGSSSIKAVELRKGRNGIEVAHLGLEPGPAVGQALEYLMELRLERGPIEEAEALELLDAWAKEHDPPRA